MKAFGAIHPAVLLTYFLSVLLIAMFLSHPILSGIALLGGILFCITLASPQEKMQDLRFYIPLFFLITITNPLFSHNGITPLFFMNGNAVTLEAILYGMELSVMMIAIMLWCKAYSYVMTSDKFIYLFGKAIPKLSLVLSMALRYIPLLKRQGKKIMRSQRAMGLYSSDSYTDRMRASMQVFSSLIGWSLENAVETGKSMRARGYGRKGRTTYNNFRFRKTDGVLLTICIVALLIVFLGSLFHQLDFFYYPKITEPLFTGRAILSYTAFAWIAFLPFIMETEEKFRWNYYRSKI